MEIIEIEMQLLLTSTRMTSIPAALMIRPFFSIIYYFLTIIGYW
jgi:hypothetical protein